MRDFYDAVAALPDAGLLVLETAASLASIDWSDVREQTRRANAALLRIERLAGELGAALRDLVDATERAGLDGDRWGVDDALRTLTGAIALLEEGAVAGGPERAAGFDLYVKPRLRGPDGLGDLVRLRYMPSPAELTDAMVIAAAKCSGALQAANLVSVAATSRRQLDTVPVFWRALRASLSLQHEAAPDAVPLESDLPAVAIAALCACALGAAVTGATPENILKLRQRDNSPD
ncbi:MAG: hypothetical protein ACOZDY_08855 [Pseudomonadota bacterium]